MGNNTSISVNTIQHDKKRLLTLLSVMMVTFLSCLGLLSLTPKTAKAWDSDVLNNVRNALYAWDGYQWNPHDGYDAAETFLNRLNDGRWSGKDSMSENYINFNNDGAHDFKVTNLGTLPDGRRHFHGVGFVNLEDAGRTGYGPEEATSFYVKFLLPDSNDFHEATGYCGPAYNWWQGGEEGRYDAHVYPAIRGEGRAIDYDAVETNVGSGEYYLIFNCDAPEYWDSLNPYQWVYVPNFRYANNVQLQVAKTIRMDADSADKLPSWYASDRNFQFDIYKAEENNNNVGEWIAQGTCTYRKGSCTFSNLEPNGWYWLRETEYYGGNQDGSNERHGPRAPYWKLESHYSVIDSLITEHRYLPGLDNKSISGEAAPMVTDSQGNPVKNDRGQWMLGPTDYRKMQKIHIPNESGSITWLVNAINTPVRGRTGLTLKKTTEDGNVKTGNVSTKGAVYKLSLTGGLKGEPAIGNDRRTWYFETNENGIIDFDNTAPISWAGQISSELYTMKVNDVPTRFWPLGHYEIREVKAPEGFYENTNLGSFDITENGMTNLQWSNAADENGQIVVSSQVIENHELEVKENTYKAKFRVGKVIYDENQGTLKYEQQGDQNTIARIGIYNASTYNYTSDYGHSLELDVPHASIDYLSNTPTNQLEQYKIGEITLNKNNNFIAESDLLSSGTFVLREIDAGAGTLLNKDWSQPIQIDATKANDKKTVIDLTSVDGTTAYTTKNVNTNVTTNPTSKTMPLVKSNKNSDSIIGYAVANKLPRGGVSVLKLITETLKSEQIGAINLENIVFHITNNSEHSVYVQNGGLDNTSRYYAPGEVCKTISTKYVEGKGYVADCDGTTLPYGTYTITEYSIPKDAGVHLNKTWEKTFHVDYDHDNNTDGLITYYDDVPNMNDAVQQVNNPEDTNAVTNLAYRAPLSFKKVEADTNRVIANCVFILKSKTTGEWHALVTGNDGRFDTARLKNESWEEDDRVTKHVTNSNDNAITQTTDENGNITWSVDESKLDNLAPVWFYGMSDPTEQAASLNQPDNTKGAVLYDDYDLFELRSSVNDSRNLIVTDFDKAAVKSAETNTLGDWTFDNHQIRIGTELLTSEGTHNGLAKQDLVLHDNVHYEELNLDDDNPTTYAFIGTLIDKETGEPLKDANGQPITSKKVLTPDETNNMRSGTIIVDFIIDSTQLAGKDIVAYEELINENTQEVISTHKNIEDTNQTIHISDIKTTALSTDTGSHELPSLDKETKANDIVTYTGLDLGKKYRMTGTLMDTETGKQIKDDNKDAIESSIEFIAGVSDENTDNNVKVSKDAHDVTLSEGWYIVRSDSDVTGTIKFADDTSIEYAKDSIIHVPCTGNAILENVTASNDYTFNPISNPYDELGRVTGTINVPFVIDTTVIAGKSITVFEECYYYDTLVAQHKDLTDTEQTLHVPSVHTTAEDEDTQSHTGTVSETSTLIDTVAYTNLIPGHEYTVKGKLMNKKTNSELLDKNNNPITASTTFVAEEPNGSVDIVFTYDSTLVKGNSVVVFEDLFKEEIPIATHSDITDKEQTVDYPGIHTTLTDTKTLSHNAMANEITTLTDTIAYENLTPGIEYTIKGWLMSKNTNTSMTEPVTLTFTPETSEGTVDMTFTINTKDLTGDSLVAFEDLFLNDKLIYQHEDIDDTDQTVTIPRISTQASNQNGDDKVIMSDENGSITIKDVISYEGLTPDTAYKVTGRLYDQSTGSIITDDNNNELVVTGEFVPEAASGETSMVFTVKADKVMNHDVTVFERVYYRDTQESRSPDDMLVATHEDENSAEQTVSIVKPVGSGAGIRSKTGDTLGGILALGVLATGIVTSMIIYKKRKIN